MKTVIVAEAEMNFSGLLRFVRGGEEVAVTRRKKPSPKSFRKPLGQFPRR
ncbi:MAG: hypothetical protein L0Z50_19350 [Verrucomicrobiales bacterium]|nr:hypothetical protein [Verrucomicrobiales bacterium]